MSVKQIGLVWEHEFERMSQQVALALADHADDSGGSIRPSISRLEWKTGISNRQIKRILKDMRKSGLLVIERKAAQHRATEYRFEWSRAVKKQQFSDWLNAHRSSSRGDSLSPLESSSGDIGDIPEVTLETPEVTTATVRGDKLSHPNHHIDPSDQPSLKPLETLQEKIDAHLHTLYNGQYARLNPVIRVDDVLGRITIGVETESTNLAAQVRSFIKGVARTRYKVSVIVVPAVTRGEDLCPLDRLKSDLKDEYYQCRGGAVFIDDNTERAALHHLATHNWTRVMLRATYAELDTPWRRKNNVPITLAAIAKHTPGATHAATRQPSPSINYTPAQLAAADAINSQRRAASAGL